MPIEFPGDELRAILEQAMAVAQIAIDLTAQELYRNVGIESPVDHGRLQGSWEIEQIDELSYRVFTNVEYALAVHDGSRPHWIGKPVNIRGVGWRYIGMHPGYAGYPFTINAIQSTELRTDEFVQMALQQTGAT